MRENISISLKIMYKYNSWMYLKKNTLQFNTLEIKSYIRENICEKVRIKKKVNYCCEKQNV